MRGDVRRDKLHSLRQAVCPPMGDPFQAGPPFSVVRVGRAMDCRIAQARSGRCSEGRGVKLSLLASDTALTVRCVKGRHRGSRVNDQFWRVAAETDAVAYASLRSQIDQHIPRAVAGGFTMDMMVPFELRCLGPAAQYGGGSLDLQTAHRETIPVAITPGVVINFQQAAARFRLHTMEASHANLLRSLERRVEKRPSSTSYHNEMEYHISSRALITNPSRTSSRSAVLISSLEARRSAAQGVMKDGTKSYFDIDLLYLKRLEGSTSTIPGQVESEALPHRMRLSLVARIHVSADTGTTYRCMRRERMALEISVRTLRKLSIRSLRYFGHQEVSWRFSALNRKSDGILTPDEKRPEDTQHHSLIAPFSMMIHTVLFPHMSQSCLALDSVKRHKTIGNARYLASTMLLGTIPKLLYRLAQELDDPTTPSGYSVSAALLAFSADSLFCDAITYREFSIISTLLAFSVFCDAITYREFSIISTIRSVCRRAGKTTISNCSRSRRIHSSVTRSHIADSSSHESLELLQAMT
nr:hypothetical protein CFP56_10089 [Quercus suber]